MVMIYFDKRQHQRPLSATQARVGGKQTFPHTEHRLWPGPELGKVVPDQFFLVEKIGKMARVEVRRQLGSRESPK